MNTAVSRLEMITPSSKQGVISKSLRRDTLCQPSLSLQISILVDKFKSNCRVLLTVTSKNVDSDRPIRFNADPSGILVSIGFPTDRCVEITGDCTDELKQKFNAVEFTGVLFTATGLLYIAIDSHR